MAAFHNNLDLRVVDLSNNQNLHEIQPFAFPRILQLSHLNLAHTSVSTLRSDAVPWEHEHLGYLDMTNVWLKCNCELAWMLRVKVHGAKCGSPLSVRGKMLKKLSLAQLGCGPGTGEYSTKSYLVSTKPGPLYKPDYSPVSGTGLQVTSVMVVGLGCVVLVGVALVISTLCCVCRHRLRHLAATCTVSATQPTYKVNTQIHLFLFLKVYKILFPEFL